ncbi:MULTISPECIES: Uma2 family endonuclease [Nostoc]|uniref:Uma2 family endonuclease n=1 Tax=Nostoc paludosum FACHB-159 TaxID=2692908 RepID=A0ABR8KAE2_9NOSO|nr:MULTISPECIES: Uma2 family endonuclease [Nostoc]MBD2680110.1 Uma2 family endonuclease [Nostoc sp. FACHB-857]MBD2736483.1 Uma2 family endonuclease [Nostoc paludosum FACHB-159]
MTQAIPKQVTFEEFVDWLPENSGVRYELHNGDIVEMAQPVGEHEEVKSFLGVEIPVEIKRLGLPYGIPNQVIVRPPEKDSGYFPDVLVLNRANLANEKLWQKQSIVSLGASIPLVIEIVSTNWRDDYYLKYADYEEMGIPEYWIVDYAALGGRNFIGNPKQSTISVCNLVDGEYQISKFRESDVLRQAASRLRIISQTFPELNLTPNQIFQAGVA